MNVCSKSKRTLSSMPVSIGSGGPYVVAPPRSSSQFADHEIFIRLRVSTLLNQTYSVPVRLVQACLQVTEQVWQPMHLPRPSSRCQ